MKHINTQRRGEWFFGGYDLFLVLTYILLLVGVMTGKVGGPAAEIIRTICRRAKMDCVLRARPWRRAILEVRKGVAQGLFVIGWNKPRTEWLHFSPPLLQTEYGFFVNAGNKKALSKLIDFNGARVGVFGPSNTSYSLEKIRDEILPEITIDMAPDDPSGFKKLAANRVTAVYSSHEVGKAIIAEHRIEGLRYALAHRKLNYFVGLSKQYTPPALWGKFNSMALELHKEGVIQRILNKYDMVAAELKPRATRTALYSR